MKRKKESRIRKQRNGKDCKRKLSSTLFILPFNHRKSLFLNCTKEELHFTICGREFHARMDLMDEDNASDQENVWDDTALIKAYDLAVQVVKDKIAQRLESNDVETKDKNDAKRMSKKSVGSKNKKLEWKVGAACRAVYSEDGKIYEATIRSINSNSKSCIVRYVGYENEEEVCLSQLMVSEGPEVREQQEKESLNDLSEAYVETSNSHNGVQTKHWFGKGNVQKKNSESKKPYAKECFTNFGSQFSPLHQHFGHSSSSNMVPPHMIPASLPPPPPLSVTSSLPSEDSEALSAMLMSWYMSGFHTGYYQGLQQAKLMKGLAKQNP